MRCIHCCLVVVVVVVDAAAFGVCMTDQLFQSYCRLDLLLLAANFWELLGLDKDRLRSRCLNLAAVVDRWLTLMLVSLPAASEDGHLLPAF